MAEKIRITQEVIPFHVNAEVCPPGGVTFGGWSKSQKSELRLNKDAALTTEK